MVDWKYLTREIFDGGCHKYGRCRKDGLGRTVVTVSMVDAVR